MIRDYNLLGPSAKDAEEKGLAAANGITVMFPEEI